MFADVSRTIDALLRSELPADIAGQVSISFATPDETFPPNGLALPAIDLFLFEITENTELRTVEPHLERRGDGAAVHVPPPRHIECHYLVTAFVEKLIGSELEEQHILGAALTVLLRHRTLPEAVLQGALAGKEARVRGLAARKPTSESGLWFPLKARPRACFHYTITVPFDVAVAEEGGSPVTTLHIGRAGGAGGP